MIRTECPIEKNSPALQTGESKFATTANVHTFGGYLADLSSNVRRGVSFWQAETEVN
jgi:hypothetical protein